jgi:DNA-binding transcriptional MerR regulator
MSDSPTTIVKWNDKYVIMKIRQDQTSDTVYTVTDINDDELILSFSIHEASIESNDLPNVNKNTKLILNSNEKYIVMPENGSEKVRVYTVEDIDRKQYKLLVNIPINEIYEMGDNSQLTPIESDSKIITSSSTSFSKNKDSSPNLLPNPEEDLPPEDLPEPEIDSPPDSEILEDVSRKQLLEARTHLIEEKDSSPNLRDIVLEGGAIRRRRRARKSARKPKKSARKSRKGRKARKSVRKPKKAGRKSRKH